MRIAGGVIFLLIGLWSLVGGGCQAFVGGAVSKGSSALNAAMKNSGAKMKMTKQQREAMAKLKGSSKGLFIYGLVSMIAGLLCIIGGIMLFVNKAKVLIFAAGGLGILAEVISIVMIGFGILAIIKIALYAFGAFAGTKVGDAA